MKVRYVRAFVTEEVDVTTFQILFHVTFFHSVDIARQEMSAVRRVWSLLKFRAEKLAARAAFVPSFHIRFERLFLEILVKYPFRERLLEVSKTALARAVEVRI